MTIPDRHFLRKGIEMQYVLVIFLLAPAGMNPTQHVASEQVFLETMELCEAAKEAVNHRVSRVSMNSFAVCLKVKN